MFTEKYFKGQKIMMCDFNFLIEAFFVRQVVCGIDFNLFNIKYTNISD